MDSVLFSKIVKQMLPSDSKVVLPGLGEFYVQQVGATLSDKGFTINPPYKKIAFKVSASRDTALAEFLAETNNVEALAAASAVDEFVQRLVDSLQSERSVDLPGLGRLLLSRTNDLFFVQDPDVEIFPEMDLLEPLSVRNSAAISVANVTSVTSMSECQPAVVVPEPVAVAEEVAVVVPEPAAVVDEPQDTTVASIQPERRFPRWALALVCAVTLVLVFFSALALAGRYCPELVDPLLYDAAELEVINTVI